MAGSECEQGKGTRWAWQDSSVWAGCKSGKDLNWTLNGLGSHEEAVKRRGGIGFHFQKPVLAVGGK